MCTMYRSNPGKPTLNIGAPPNVLQCTALWGNAFTEHVVIGNIFVAQKYLVTPSVFKLQKWILHKYGVEFNQKSKYELIKLWPGVGREFEARGSEQRCSQS